MEDARYEADQDLEEHVQPARGEPSKRTDNTGCYEGQSGGAAGITRVDIEIPVPPTVLFTKLDAIYENLPQ